MSPVRIVLVAIVLMLAAYTRVAWQGEFVYEDMNAVVLNPAVHADEPVQINRARWITALTHRWTYEAFGLNARAFHAVNLALHIANSGLVYLVGDALLLTPQAAAIGAAVFLVHPMQTESVAYVASRSELLSTFLALGAFWIIVERRQWWAWAASIVGIALALGAKESAVAIVPLVGLYFLMFEMDWRRWTRWLLPSVIVAGILAIPVTLISISVLHFDVVRLAEYGPFYYAGLQSAAFWRYVGMWLVPMSQSVDHDFALLAPWIVWSALTLFAAASVSVLWIYRRVPTLAFLVAWPLIAVAPRLVMRIPEILNEHQVYFGHVGLALLSGAAVALVIQSVEWSRS